ncbi:hypothetical protein, partial [Klebsiella variicola]|uniref:hypothetical protein n=1 Tax=Klebsiella variicola TaxID=244366 RepID=UPI001D1229F3
FELSSIALAMGSGTASILFMYTAYKLNMLAFWLSPVVILLLLIYPAGKRFTQYVHLILGLG